MSIPQDRRFSAAHIWVRAEGDHLIMGVTKQAAKALGDLEHIELPEIDAQVSADLACGSVESIKSVSDLIAPLDARVIEHNGAVLQDPALVNEDPYGDGWLIRLADYHQTAYETLLDAAGYQLLVDD